MGIRGNDGRDLLIPDLKNDLASKLENLTFDDDNRSAGCGGRSHAGSGFARFLDGSLRF